MKAGLTVLVAIASASVNAHVKVETVNFDEDLLNTEKNIAGTFAWKEKPIGGDGPDIVVKFKVEDIKYEGRGAKSGRWGQEPVYYRCTGNLTIDTEEYPDVTLVFKHDLLLVQIQNDETVVWMENTRFSRFPNMAQNYQKMQKLYKNSQDKNKAMKQTNEKMEWTISHELPAYTEMVNQTAKVKKGLEPKKKVSTEEEKTQV